jgi:hypothetical protein
MKFVEVVRTMENGRKILIMPVSNSPRKKIKITEDDYNELAELGVGLPWLWALNQVWVRCGGRNLAVARLLLDAGKGEVISYLDQDTRNLVRSNLVRGPGNGKYRTRDRIVARITRSGQPEIIIRQVPTRDGFTVYG